MPESRLLSLLLANTSLLCVQYLNTEGHTATHSFNLNYGLGNVEGSFQPLGFEFSQSARGVVLVGNTLHAELMTSGGVWWHDEVLIQIKFPSQDFQPPTIHFHRNPSQRLKPWCQNLRLIDKWLLAAQCLQPDGTYRDSYLNLNKCLGERDGAFDRHGTGFSSSASSVDLTDTTLLAIWKPRGANAHQESRAAIQLGTILRCTDGGLKPLRQNIPSRELEFEILRDYQWERHLSATVRPHGVTNLRLINFTQKRYWYLLVDIPSPGGAFQESTLIVLNEIFGPHVDEMFNGPWFSSPDIPEHARSTKLDNGILTASFESEEGWAEKTIILRNYIAIKAHKWALNNCGWGCPACRDLFYAGVFYTPWEGRTVELNLSHVRDGHRLGQCFICRLIHDTIKQYTPTQKSHQAWIMTAPGSSQRMADHRARREVQLVIRAVESDGGRTSWLRSKADSQARTIEARCTIVLDIPGINRGSNDDEIASRVPQHLRTLAINKCDPAWVEPGRRWSVIKEWIQVCSSQHQHGQKQAESKKEKGKDEVGALPPLPSRYLNINTKNGTVKVVTSNSGERGIYACLSHFSGGRRPCTLSASTTVHFSIAIPHQILPPVFANAIAACRKLGISRLWIAELCIQQDSAYDWEQESQKIGQYYSQCEVCISATSSAAPSLGFDVEATRIPAVRSSDKSGDFSLLAYPTDFNKNPQHFVHMRDMETMLQEFPLLTRAWGLQERWLAPRVLHFTKNEVVFECAECIACECGGVSEHLVENIGLNNVGFSSIRSTTTAQHGLLRRRTRLEDLKWDELVPMFSGLSLTVLTDRLAALSGLAAAMYRQHYVHRELPEESAPPAYSKLPEYDEPKDKATVTSGPGTEYFTGLWLQTLPRDMAWFVGETLLRNTASEQRLEVVGSGHGNRRRPRPSEYLAPSWSWASVLDAVRYLEAHDQQPLFEVLETHVSLATNDPFGRVEEGCSLQLRGNIFETGWGLRPTGKDGAEKAYVLSDLVGTQQLDAEEDRGRVLFSPDCDIESPGPSQVRPRDTLYVFPLLKQKVKYARFLLQAAEAMDASRTTCCLVLKAVGGLDQKFGNVFERVGFTEYVNLKKGVRNVDVNHYEERDFFLV
ncbi:hypothetical protein B0H63DRAFT_488202 [Podospora didyma]|uniref:Heterokaryon incompatibility domain-containing protein n=1 Tax=Podospora didyma TaxID=330526 RepID=A0AAE0N2A9_9PEZI|nr:hypothetical protein B0H63DRAFT_488202 [Podospora didyma]